MIIPCVCIYFTHQFQACDTYDCTTSWNTCQPHCFSNELFPNALTDCTSTLNSFHANPQIRLTTWLTTEIETCGIHEPGKDLSHDSVIYIAKCQILKTTKPTLQNTQHHTLSYRHTHTDTHSHTHTHIHTTWFCANPRSAHTFLQQILRPQERARTHFYDKFCYEAPRNPF